MDISDVPRGTATPVPKWRVRILGIDSSKAAQYSAQGFVKLDVLGAVNGATRSHDEETTRDLVIALVHHHLLPIAALEQSSQHVSSVLNTTTLVNAGSVLENCATNNVNLVLHGHEHMRNIARYGVPGKTLASDLVVLGAGSATGADTWAGCDATRASINVLELRRDRSVYVQEQRIVGGQWQDCGDAVCLLDGRQIREARVLRRDDLKARPVSRIERHFAFTEYRDIDVRETRTFWPVTKDHQLVFDVHRLSGSPILGKLNVDWEGGGTDRWAGNPEGGEKAANFGRPPDGGRGYRLQLRIDDWRTKAQRLELEYTWSRSAILTMTDLQLLRDDQLDDFRRAGKEAVSIHVTDPLDSLTLSISLPPALLPQGGRIEVHVGHLENGIEKIEPHQELQEFLHVMPGGYATLTVPFPLPECRYFLAWRPHAAFAPDASVTATRDRIGGNGDHIASKIVADLMPRLARRCTVALYVPELIEAGGVQFRLRGFAADVDAAAAGEARPPEVYRARDEYDSVLGAWYGEPSWSSVDPRIPTIATACGMERRTSSSFPRISSDGRPRRNHGASFESVWDTGNRSTKSWPNGLRWPRPSCYKPHQLESIVLIRFPAPPGGLARSLSLARSGQDGDEVLLTPLPSLPLATQQQPADPKTRSGVDSTSSSLNGGPTSPTGVNPAKP